MIDFDKTRLRRYDSLNWCIEQQRPNGKWRITSYFSKLEQAANYLLTLSINDADSIQELISEIETARDSVISTVKAVSCRSQRVS